MDHIIATFSGYSVNNLAQAKEFYTGTLGLELIDESMGLSLQLPGGGRVFIYEKTDHQPATFTVLNFVVDDIDTTMNDLLAAGIQFEQYELGNGAKQDERGVLRGLEANMGPDIAWFKDPAGNVLAILQDS